MMRLKALVLTTLAITLGMNGIVTAGNVAPTYRNVQDQLAKLSPNSSNDLKASAKKLDDYLAKLVKTNNIDARLAAYRALKSDTDQWSAWATHDPAANDVATALNHWIAPRLKAVEYAISARDAIARNEAWVTDEHRLIYKELVQSLTTALEQYESADKTGLRIDAREKIRDLVEQLSKRLKNTQWPDAEQIIATIKSRWESPNILITVSAEGLRPLLDREIVKKESILFKGRTSYVTPRERQGYGLIPSDDAIAFYISQAMTSVTPVTDFEDQVKSNNGGRILSKAYALENTIQNDSVVTTSFAIRPTGIAMSPANQNNVRPNLGIAPKSGGGFSRAIMGMAGMNQQKIINEIYSKSIGQIQSEAEISSKELGELRANEAANKLNVAMKPYRRSDNAMAYDKVVVERIQVRTEPTHIHAQARLLYDRPGHESIGPIDVVPPIDPVDQRYITAAIHIPNLMENLAANFFEELSSRGTTTIAFLPDNNGDGAAEVEIQSGQDLLQLAIGESLRITKQPKGARLNPGSPFAALTISEKKLVPHFTMDDKGHLVMMFKAFKMDIASPSLTILSEGRMGGAVRIDSPGAELDMEIINLPATVNQQERLALKVHSFQLDPRSKIYAYSEPGKEPSELSAFRKAAVLAGASAFLSSKPIDLPLDALKIGDKVSVVKVSPLGKTGWYQFVINADGILKGLGQEDQATPELQSPAPGSPKSDVAIQPMSYVEAPACFIATVPAGSTYWVVPGTNPPRVEYRPASDRSASTTEWVNVRVQAAP